MNILLVWLFHTGFVLCCFVKNKVTMSLKGKLETFYISSLFQFLDNDEKTGILTVTDAKKEVPLLRGIEVDGRTVVVFSPLALTCGWTRRATCTAACKRYATEDAFKIGINVIIYAMTH